jgi:hypothetical protein
VIEIVFKAVQLLLDFNPALFTKDPNQSVINDDFKAVWASQVELLLLLELLPEEVLASVLVLHQERLFSPIDIDLVIPDSLVT